MKLDAKIPAGPIAEKWDRHKFEMKLVNPANKRKYTIIVVGTGLAGASAAASLGELGYNVLNFCIQDSPRRAHSIAAQGGINAAKNYQNDGDSVYRLFYDTVKGGDYRVARSERLPAGAAERQHHRPVRRAGRAVRARIRRPARQPVVRRRAGVAHVLRARPDRPAAAARRLSVADAAGAREERSSCSPRREMLDLVVVDGQARGIIVRNLIDRRARALRRRRGASSHRRLRHGLLPLDQRGELERHGGVARAQARRALRQPVLHADPPDLHPGQRRPPVEADADEREPAQRRPRLGAEEEGRQAAAGADSRGRARLLPRAQVPELRQPRAARRRVAQRQAGVRRRPRRRRQRPRGLPRFHRRHQAARRSTSSRRSTATCSTCTRRSPTRTRTRCRCASTRPSTTRWAGSGWTTT